MIMDMFCKKRSGCTRFNGGGLILRGVAKIVYYPTDSIVGVISLEAGDRGNDRMNG